MAKNQILFDILSLSVLKPDAAQKAEQLATLDALMQADLSDATNFRQVILNKYKVLGLNDDFVGGQTAASDDFLSPENDGGKENNLRALQRMAAEKRVLFGLEGLPLSALHEIIQAPNLREHLVTISSFTTLKDSYLWNGAKDNPAILSDAALDRIKERASMLIMKNLADEVTRATAEINSKADANEKVLPTLEDSEAAIAMVAHDLAGMEKLIGDLRENLTRNNDIVNRRENEAAKRGIDGAIQGAAEKLDHLKALTKQKVNRLLSLIDTKANEVTATLKVARPDTDTTEVLAKIVKTASDGFAVMRNALKVAELSGTPTNLDDARTKKENIERDFIQLTVKYYTKIAVEKSDMVSAEISKVKLDGLVDAAAAKSKFDEIKKIQAEVEKGWQDAKTLIDQRKGLFNTKPTEFEAINASVRSAEEAHNSAKEALEVFGQAIKAKFGEKVLEGKGKPMPRKSSQARLLFLEQEGRLQAFTDTLINAGTKFDYDLPTKSRDGIGGGITLTHDKPAKATYFDVVKLGVGDCIRSAAVFPNANMPGRTVTGLLKQTHDGTVTDMTTDALSEEQKTLLAIKQAKMFLTNIDLSKEVGDIVIKGNGKDENQKAQAERVYAALLTLKDQIPALKKVKIVSEVVGVTGPLWKRVTHFYAKAGLKDVSKPVVNREKEQVGELAKAQAIRAKMRAGLPKEEDKRAHDLSEGDTITPDGGVTRKGPR